MADVEYVALTEEEKHDMMVAFLHSQEHDHFWHGVNRDRYHAILAKKDLKPQFRKRIEELLAETEDRLHEVTNIMETTKAALPEVQHVEAAKIRLKARG